MAKRILIAVAAVLVLFLGFVALQPGSYTVTRETTIGVAPAAVYPYVTDFTRWAEWSPWEGIDADLKKEMKGTPGTVGHGYSWKGEKTGEGAMEITALQPGASADYALHFIKPFESHNTVAMRLTPEGTGTKVSWSMTGPKNFMLKAMMLFMDIEGSVGKDFEKGLGQLKSKAEAAPATPPMTTGTSGGATSG